MARTSRSIARSSIQALRTLNSLTGPPTDEERDVLGQWVGWGPFSDILAMSPAPEWVKAADALDELVSVADITSARDIVDTSFYTPAPVIDAVFALLRQTGFTGGRILEPGCGSGTFMSRAPADFDVQWTGVEIDPTAVRFARALNPDAAIIESPLQKVVFKTGEFDAAIGNVPFSRSTVYDTNFPSASLHEYFALRALDAVRPGGYIIIVTSRYALDGSSGLDRLDNEADLICAVRLPTGTFEGTGVVADILVLRRRDSADAERRGWAMPMKEMPNYGYYRNQTVSVRADLELRSGHILTTVNGVWGEHPDCVAGVLTPTGFAQSPLAVVTEDVDRSILNATAAAVAYITPDEAEVRAPDFADVVLTDGEGRKERSFHLVDGQVHSVVAGTLMPVARGGAELVALIGLRDAALELIELESHPERPDAEIAPTRAQALALYTSYVQAFGALNRGVLREGKVDPESGESSWTWVRPTMGGFLKDPDYMAAIALETFDQDSGEAHPAPILLRRVGAHPPKAVSAESPEEGLSIALGEGVGVHLGRIGDLLGTDGDDATVAALGDLVFADPDARGAWTIARNYLAGDVRSKLAAATAAAASDHSYDRNVAALAEVVPAELTPIDIRVQLGATWILPEDVTEFGNEVLGGRARIAFTPAIALWEVDASYARPSADATLTYGIPDMGPYEILSCALNSKTPHVYDTVWASAGMKKVKNPEQTLAASERMRALQERFATWVWEDDKRAARLLTEYNRRFNSHVVRRGDGSYLTFPGLDENINLWSWQRDAVDRVISGERVMIGHVVGAGKTKSMICSAMTLRRLGLARKPLVIVPNHLLEQIAREARQAYPTGRFLIASKDDLSPANRRLFAARCATGDWDLVVMTHNAFTSLSVDPDTESDWLETQKAELRWHLSNPGNAGRRGIKQVASAVRKLEQRITELRDGVSDENQVMFEQLGIDHISVDEAHLFRRLQITAKAEGFSLGSSKRATDLLLKIETLAERYPAKPIVAFYTGTPWSNTLAETFVWQRYLQPERLRAAGVEHFDAWAATFVRYETRVEVTPDGSGFRMHRRPSVIQNVPELRMMLSDVADLLTADAIGLERPETVWENIVVEPGPQQAQFVAYLAERADLIHNGRPIERDNGKPDNILVVCNDGRSAALDPQLVGLAEHSSKVDAVAQTVAEQYAAERATLYGSSPKPGSFQLVLCDLGTPHPGDAQVYGRIRSRLIERGVPAARIRYIHDATTDKARAHLFALCRDGDVSVLIGSTPKVGLGTNIQTRLSALHHVDPPWRPSDMEQREGRGRRPGNHTSLLRIFRYLTRGSFDGFMFDAIERKARFIAQMFSVEGTVREFEDVNEVVLSYAQVKALASGNPDLLKQAEVASEVRRLRVLRSVWLQGAQKLRRESDTASSTAATLHNRIDTLRAALHAVTESGDLSVEPGERDLDNVADAVKTGATWASGRRHGFDIKIRPNRSLDRMDDRIVAIELSYTPIHSLTVSKRDARLPVDELAGLIADRFDAWLENLPQEIERLRERQATQSNWAASSAAAAEASAFEWDAELAEAERTLSAIDAAIVTAAEKSAEERAAA